MRQLKLVKFIRNNILWIISHNNKFLLLCNSGGVRNTIPPTGIHVGTEYTMDKQYYVILAHNEQLWEQNFEPFPCSLWFTTQLPFVSHKTKCSENYLVFY